MSKIYTIFAAMVLTVLILGTVNLVYADDSTLTDQEKAAFITREEFEAWETAFKASLSELDSQATDRIISDMGFYDMQFRFTENYKGEEYIDSNTGLPTDKLKKMINDKKKEKGLL